MNTLGRASLAILLVLILGILHPEFPGTVYFVLICACGAGMVFGGKE